MEHQPQGNTIYLAPDPPDFPNPPSSVDLSPLKFVLALLALVTIPALAYTFFFSLKCPPSNPFNRRRRRGNSDVGDLHPDGPSPVLDSQSPAASGEKEAQGAISSELKYKEAKLMQMDSECPVCLSLFKDDEEIKVLSACKHSFHSTCVNMWLSSHSNCPVCRAQVIVPPAVAASDKPSDRMDDRRSNRRARNANGIELQQGLPNASDLV